MALTTEYTDDWGFNALGPEQGISVVEPYQTLPDLPLQLLAVAPASGLFAAAGASSVVIGKTANLRAALEADKPVESLHTIEHSSPTQLAFSASEKQLFVYSADQRISAYNTGDWSLDFISAPLESSVTSLKVFSSKQGLVLATQSRIVAVDEHGSVSTVSTDTTFTLGSNDEIITPSHPDLDLSSLENVGKVLALQSLAPGWVFLIAQSTDADDEYVTYMRHDDKWLEVENTLMAPDTNRPLMWHQGTLKSWPSSSVAFTSVAASSYSSELMLLSPSHVLKPMNETDNLPFTTEDEDVIAVGGVLDLTDETPRESLTGVEGKFVFPLWLLLTQEGRILGWNIVCREASKENAKWEVPSKVEVPDLPKITLDTKRDIADEEIDEISESDTHDNPQVTDEQEATKDDNVSVEESISDEPENDNQSATKSNTIDESTDTEDNTGNGTYDSDGSSDKDQEETKNDKASFTNPSTPGEAGTYGHQTNSANANANADAGSSSPVTAKLPKATFGSSWASKPGFGSWANSDSKQSPISQFALSSTKSPFGGGTFGSPGSAVSSAFGSKTAKSPSPFTGFGSSSPTSPSSSKTAASSNPATNIFGAHQVANPFAAFRNTPSPFSRLGADGNTNDNAANAENVIASSASQSTSKDEAKPETAALESTKSGTEKEADEHVDLEPEAGATEAHTERKHQNEADQRRQTEVEVEADRKAKSEAEERRKVDAENQAEAERKAKSEAEERRKADAENQAEAERKAKSEAEERRKADAENQAKAERKAKSEAKAKAEADHRAKEFAAKIESTVWLDDRASSFISPAEAFKGASLDGLNDMDAIYAQTNLLFQVLDHNLSVLEQSDIYEKHSQAHAFSEFSEWNVGDAPALRDEVESLLASRTHEAGSSMDATLRELSKISNEAYDAVADLTSLKMTLAELDAEASDSAYKLRPLPARSSHYRRELQGKLGKISRMMTEAKEAVLLKRTEFGETIGYSNILVAVESIDSRLHALGSYINNPVNGTSGLGKSIVSRASAGGDSLHNVTGRLTDSTPISTNNMISAAGTALNSEHPALLRDQRSSTDVLLNVLKQRDASSCITSTSL